MRYWEPAGPARHLRGSAWGTVCGYAAVPYRTSCELVQYSSPRVGLRLFRRGA